MLWAWIASSRGEQIKIQIVFPQWGPYANGYSLLVGSTPQGDGTVYFMARGGKKKRKMQKAYITLYQGFILARRSIVVADSLLSKLKSTKCELKCLRPADKLSHKFYSETLKIWCNDFGSHIINK